MWQLPKMDPSNILKYLRKSRTDDPMLTVEEVLSKHEQMLDEWVQRNFPGAGAVPESNCFREVVSGETIESRPKVQELLRQIESPTYKAVLIVEPQRLSRGDLEDIGRIVKLLRYTNTIVITLQYTYDLTDERDRDLFERELKRGNEFLEYQKRIMNNGRLLSVQNGNFIGQTPPYGYRKIVLKEGKRKIHTLEPDPETAPIVQQIFREYADGTSAYQIVQRLNAQGIQTAKGEAWRVSGVKHIIQNEHYIGNVTWNRRQTLKVVEDGEILATRPRNHDYISFPGRHPAIIDHKLWEAAQEIHNAHVPIKHKAKYANPFAGLIYCHCGSHMSLRKYTRDGKQRSAPRLLCENQTICGTASCTEEEMRAAIVQALRAAIADFDLKIDQADENQSLDREKTIMRLEKRLDELNRQELSQWDKYTQEKMPKHIFDALNEKLLADRAAVTKELEDIKGQLSVKINYTKKRETFASAASTLLDPDAEIKAQNVLLKQCIEQVTYNRKSKDSGHPRWGTPYPIELDIIFKI